MVFPLIKLGYLAFKQLSKPLARVIRDKAKTNPFFRTYFIIPPAQIYHKIETVSKMHILGLGKPSHVEKLNEAMAIELGSDLLGEFIIFMVATGTLTLEYFRSSKSQARKDEELEFKFKQLGSKIHELGLNIEKQNYQIRELERTLSNYHSEQQNFVVRSLNKLVKKDNNSSKNDEIGEIMASDDYLDEENDDGTGDIVFSPIYNKAPIKKDLSTIMNVCDYIFTNK